MTIRTCPACSRRWAQVVDPNCCICNGNGYLELGTAALHHHDPDVVSRAVEYSIESAARVAIASDSSAAGIGKARRRIQGTVATLRASGILAKTAPAADHQPITRHPGTPGSRHQAAVALTRQLPVDPYQGDRNVLDAPPLVFDADDRPLAQGGIPGFSAAGYICHLARATDPIDPLELDTRNPLEAGTRGTVQRRHIKDRQATSLAKAAWEAAEEKETRRR